MEEIKEIEAMIKKSKEEGKSTISPQQIANFKNNLSSQMKNAFRILDTSDTSLIVQKLIVFLHERSRQVCNLSSHTPHAQKKLDQIEKEII